ncbi:pyridoxamine 5'-phosphate oxidase family protein [Malonomonas rubra]|uniref:pyridoxamine 5'-phosphate oxidase family protein n=1 Tax=Malonomonas rubra TaxID=57040 RepID=UPI0026EB298D|nr:pyridoxamine 5'-phosphate oxidase family protein [Malonomonas rubra]
MRRHDREISELQQLEEILKQGRELNLAMLDGDQPYVLPLNYGYADGCLYIHCANQGQKLDCLSVNPQVSFCVSEVVQRVTGGTACEWNTRFRSVVGRGRAEIIDDREGKIAGYDVIMRHFGGQVGGYKEKHLEASLVIRIRIDSMTGKQSLPSR